MSSVKKELIEYLKDNIKTYLDSGNELLNNLEILSFSEIINKLNEILKMEEEEIDKLKTEGDLTIVKERQLSKFAKDVTEIIFFKTTDFTFEDNIKILCDNKYVGFGFFSNLNENMHFENSFSDTIYYQLYLSLAIYYKDFYGRFSDNEEALILLFKFYRDNENRYTEKDKNLIVEAIYNHITNAGTPTDFGFAYGGIEIIKKYISKIPVEMVIKILDSYEFFRVVNNNVYRHQIYCVIKFSRINKVDKMYYKFWYLDSLLIANVLNPILNEIKSNNIFVLSDLTYEKNLMSNEIELYELDNGIKSYWTNNKNELNILDNRKFIIDTNISIAITLNKTNNIIISKGPYLNNSPQMHFTFEEDNWILDEIDTKKKYIELKNFLMEDNDSHSNIKNSTDDKKSSFSLMYISNFRGIKNQLINFDHKFHFNSDKITIFEGKNNIIPHFYNPSVYSLTCIVGKNGTGKSSIVNFLKDYFFILMKMLIDGVVECDSGYLKETDVINKLIDKDCEFFIVFSLDNKPYFISNMKPDKIDSSEVDIEGFSNGIILNESELSKVIYLSNMFSFHPELIKQFEENGKIDDKIYSQSQKLFFNSRQVDYSELSSVNQKITQINLNHHSQIINKDLVYQLVFLYFINQNQNECKHIQFDFINDLSITNPSTQDTKSITFNSNWNFKEFLNQYSKFLRGVDSKIIYFSSGEYAKFSFFSKIYWCLHGHTNYFDTLLDTLVEQMQFDKNIIKSDFSQDHVIKENEFSLIFIDEGELYYHPEWQRLYIYELMKFIEILEIRSSLQIVITSNSPFILSDILTEDIVYLSSSANVVNERTLAENIHRLLTDDFYMSYTIGENSRLFIEEIIEVINSNNDDTIKTFLKKYYNQLDKNEWYEKIFILINKIAEPIYRNKLTEMLNNSKKLSPTKLNKLELELSVIKQKEHEIQKEIDYLKESGNNDIH